MDPVVFPALIVFNTIAQHFARGMTERRQQAFQRKQFERQKEEQRRAIYRWKGRQVRRRSGRF
jgi:hypothetical protein